jgi:hypothetical protein
MAALLNNLATILDQLQKKPKPDGKSPAAPNPLPGTPGYKPQARPRGTLLTGADTPVQPRKTLLGG